MTSSSDQAIPTIDFRAFRSGDAEAKSRTVAEIGRACEDYGFMSIVGHGLREATVKGAFAAAEEFFSLPEAEKMEVVDTGTNRGFKPMFDGGVDGKRRDGNEAFSMGHPTVPADPELAALPSYAPTPWPRMPGFRERIERCYDEMYGLGQDFMRAIALHLGAPEDFFEEASRETYSNMRVLHYPPAERVADVTDVGVRAHVDQGLITLLMQDMNGGLKVKAPSEEWLPVHPRPDAIVVNIGKLLRRWTNGRYQAALHTVVNTSGRERFSIPLFVHPSFRTMIDPRSLVGEAAEGSDFAPVVAGEHAYAGLKASRFSWREPVPAIN